MHTRHALFLSALFSTVSLFSMQEDSAATSCELSRYNNMSLHEASKKGDIEAIQVLLQRGVDVNVKDKYGHTSLHIASYLGNLEIAQLLLTNNADVYAKNERGLTSLHNAVALKHIAIADLLLRHGAHVDAQANDDFDNVVPLYYAVTNGDMQAIELLVQHNANLRVKNKEGESFLNYAMKHDHIDVMRFFLDNGIDANEKINDTDSFTLLQVASCFGKKDAVQLLLEEGAYANIMSDKGCTALDFAKDDTIKQLLVEHGAKKGRDLIRHNSQDGNCIVQ